MQTLNAPVVVPVPLKPVPVKQPSRYIRGFLAFGAVMAFATLGSLVAPSVALLHGADYELVRSILRVMLSACIPFGFLIAWSTARYASRRASCLIVLKYAPLLLAYIPLSHLPGVAGPLLDYAALVYGSTTLFALISGKILRPAPCPSCKS